MPHCFSSLRTARQGTSETPVLGLYYIAESERERGRHAFRPRRLKPKFFECPPAESPLAQIRTPRSFGRGGDDSPPRADGHPICSDFCLGHSLPRRAPPEQQPVPGLPALHLQSHLRQRIADHSPCRNFGTGTRSDLPRVLHATHGTRILASPYTISSGLGGATTWNLGQVWNLTFPLTEMPRAGGNITVYAVSSYQLLFSVILPGTTTAPPPTVTSTAVTPATPTIGTIYTIYATISGNFASNSVYVNLAAVPGGPSTPQKMSLNSQGFWTYTVPSGATTNGTFYGFVDTRRTALAGSRPEIVVITIYPSSSSTSGPLSVGVVLVPSPPNSGVSESVQAVVTYTGSIANAGLTVSFSGTSSPAGFTFSGAGPAGLTISGPSSVTVVSQTTWTIPEPATLYTYAVTATATVAGVGTVTGTTSFEPVLITAAPPAVSSVAP